jgi:NADH dehydrogenase/NADH:ubiquinone oxidoreductase subunit G
MDRESPKAKNRREAVLAFLLAAHPFQTAQLTGAAGW